MNDQVAQSVSEKKPINVSKFTLTGGKVVYLRDPKISDTETATKLAGKEAGPDNQAHLMVLFQKEMLKCLIMKIDNKVPTLQEKLAMDNLFTFKEYTEVSRAMKMVLGEDEGGKSELIPELTTI